MKRAIGIGLLVLIGLALTKYSGSIHDWATQYRPDRLAVGSSGDQQAGVAVAPARSPRPAAGLPAATATFAPADAHPAAPSGRSAIADRVIQVVDGDTIKVRIDRRIEVVQYIGVVAIGRAAAETNRRLVDGRDARLELDSVERDREGRLLAYVHVGETMT